jgi:hypothetical protein
VGALNSEGSRRRRKRYIHWANLAHRESVHFGHVS